MIDIAREFPCVNSASGGAMVRIESCGHQSNADNPLGFARTVVDMQRGPTPQPAEAPAPSMPRGV
jgi:hypothetical protein